MAFHPFRTFQKHQKGCMVGAVLLAMISFLFLGVIIQLLGGRGGGGSQITTYAETRRFGKITDFEIQHLRNERQMLNRFFNALLQNLVRAGMDEEKQQALFPLDMLVRQFAQGQTPEQLIDTWLVTQYAKEEGISPDWENDMLPLLKELSGDYLSNAIYDETLRSIGMSQQTLEYLLAQHIRWRQMITQFSTSVGAVSPATRWDWYQRLYRQVTIEAAGVSVDSFIGQVSEPSAAQLNAFFEQHKGKRYNPLIAESGFIMPMELAFQYVATEPTQQLLDSITEEEMRAYYEENKETLFIKRPAGQIDLPQFPSLPGMMPGTMPFPVTPSRPSLPMIPLLTEDGEGESANENREPTTVSPEADGSEMETTPQTEQPAPVEESPKTEEEAAPEMSATSRVTTRLVSYQAEEEDGSQIVEVPLIAIEEDEAEMMADTGGLTPPAHEEEANHEKEAKEEEPVDLSVLYRPFDEVKDEIRETLAREKAIDALPGIQEKMKEYTNIYHTHFEQSKPIPPMPDLTGFVAEQGLALKTVPLGSIYTVMQTELAKGSLERGLVAQLFSRTPLLFEAETFVGNNGPVLYWVTEEKPEMRPKNIGDVRETVLTRWKEIEARTLALKKAEGLASEARASGNPLAEVFAGRADVLVVETESFTWKTYEGLHPYAMFYGQSPIVSEVREKGVPVGDAEMLNKVIAAPGSDFMETVFSLQIGETGVVFNQPQSMAYIVRVMSSSPSTETLWEQFQTTNLRMYIGAGQREMESAAFEAWLEEIQKKTGFRWLNKPDAHEMYGDY